MPRRTHTTTFTLMFGERMRSLRIELGYSLGQLSTKTGISKGHLSSIELGFAVITVESLARIAAGLELSPMLFMGFPKKDKYAVILDLARKLPTTHINKMEKIMKRWIKELEAQDWR